MSLVVELACGQQLAVGAERQAAHFSFTPSNSFTCLPASTSQRRRVRSQPPLTACLPSRWEDLRPRCRTCARTGPRFPCPLSGPRHGRSGRCRRKWPACRRPRRTCPRGALFGGAERSHGLAGLGIPDADPLATGDEDLGPIGRECGAVGPAGRLAGLVAVPAGHFTKAGVSTPRITARARRRTSAPAPFSAAS